MAERSADAIKDSGEREIGADLQALRDDVGKLAEQLATLMAAKGNAAFQGARDTMAEASGAMGDVADTFADAIDESLERRPYTTLAICAGLGFLAGALWRR